MSSTLDHICLDSASKPASLSARLSFTLTRSASDSSELKIVSWFFNVFKINRKVMSTVITVDSLLHNIKRLKGRKIWMDFALFFVEFSNLWIRKLVRDPAGLQIILDLAGLRDPNLRDCNPYSEKAYKLCYPSIFAWILYLIIYWFII